MDPVLISLAGSLIAIGGGVVTWVRMRTIDKEMAAKLRVEGNNVIVASSERLVNMALRQLEEMEDRLGEMKLALEQARHAEELMRGDLRRLTQRVGHLEDFIRLNDLEVPHHANGSRG